MGWGWDFNYNRRFQVMYNQDMIYFDGTGRRERFKAKIENDGVYGILERNPGSLLRKE